MRISTRRLRVLAENFSRAVSELLQSERVYYLGKPIFYD